MSRSTAIAGGRANRRSEAIYDDLRHRIIQTELKPGERLGEQKLASEYGISRTPIRQVLDRLANDGLVTMRPGAGASVSPVDFGSLAEVWAVRMKITELMADVITVPLEDDVAVQATALLQRVRDATSAAEVVTLFDEYHVILLTIMGAGPVRLMFDQMYAQTARMFTILLPDLDLVDEIGIVALELEQFVAACEAKSVIDIAATRLTFLQSLLERINSIPLLKPPSTPPQLHTNLTGGLA